MNTPFSRHLTTLILAVAFSVTAVGFLTHKTTLLSGKPVVLRAGATLKPAPRGWGEMKQIEVDALTSELAKLDKREVAIFCGNRDCDDLALDFDNAFESAKWKSGIERPLFDSNKGLNVAPDNPQGRALAQAINRATGNRFQVGTIPADIGDRLAVIISKP